MARTRCSSYSPSWHWSSSVSFDWIGIMTVMMAVSKPMVHEQRKLRTSRRPKLKKIPTLQLCWHRFATYDATSRNTTRKSCTSTNPWVQNSLESYRHHRKSNHQNSFALVLHQLLAKVLQTDGLRRWNRLAWTMSLSSKKLPGSRRFRHPMSAFETGYGQLWQNTTRQWPRRTVGKKWID